MVTNRINGFRPEQYTMYNIRHYFAYLYIRCTAPSDIPLTESKTWSRFLILRVSFFSKIRPFYTAVRWFYIFGGKIKQYKFNFENKVAVFRLVFYFLGGVRGENQAFFGRQIYEKKLGWRRSFVLMRSDGRHTIIGVMSQRARALHGWCPQRVHTGQPGLTSSQD